MARPITLCTGQFADMDFDDLCKKAKAWGYDGLELGCWARCSTSRRRWKNRTTAAASGTSSIGTGWPATR